MAICLNNFYSYNLNVQFTLLLNEGNKLNCQCKAKFLKAFNGCAGKRAGNFIIIIIINGIK